MDSDPAWPPPSINIVLRLGNATKMESPCPTSSTSTSSLPFGRRGANGCDAIRSANITTAPAAAHSAALIGRDICRRTIGFKRRAMTARAHIARNTKAAKNAITSHMGGPGIRYDIRGQCPNQFTVDNNIAAQRLDAFASSKASRDQTNDASTATKPRGTIIAVNKTAGMLL